MKAIQQCIIIGLILVCVSPYSQAQTPPAKHQSDFWDRYTLIVTRNIFSRNRRLFQESSPGTDSTPPPPPIESRYILRGITRENTLTTAFIEDLDTGRIAAYITGSAIARGRIQSVTLDSLNYVTTRSQDPNLPSDMNDISGTQVRIGQTLLGHDASRNTSLDALWEAWSSLPSTTSSSQKEDTSTPDNEQDSEIIRQLMERRKRELGQ